MTLATAPVKQDEKLRSKKVAHYQSNNRLGGPGKNSTEVWAYVNQDDVDFHLDTYDKDGGYLGHVSFTVKRKDLKRG